MANKKTTVSIKVEDLDEAIEKANQLKKLLEEAQKLIDSLAATQIKVY
ncbi:hypothetical protein Ami103574_04290 [Aminipila butyrica]|uniref:Uncharacterized protein n=1 Tax=Aminipila butyrica TaxID=433296 RepID=A0A858BSM7_9FIRM|nr:hypothetical protein [Aminipila butyrica]QIB68587.1 hypothetical protein Ami103574_04290 [Aminipila butyrica]